MQKKLLLVLMTVTSALASHAQVEKNDWLLGGAFGFGTSSNTYTGGTATGSNSNLNPELGWAVAKNSVIGFRGGFSTSTSKDNVSSVKQTITNYLAGLFWKKLFPVNEKVGWYGDLSGSYTYGQNRYNGGGIYQKMSANGFNASLSPGVYYKPSKKVFLTAGFGGLNYNYAKNDVVGSPVSSKTNSFNINLLNYYTFGVSFIISKDHQM